MTGALGGPEPQDRQFLALDDKINQRSVLERLSAANGGGKPPAPLVVELDMTSYCDFECPECISIGVLGTRRFNRTRLHTLAAEMADIGVRAVILTGGGEPLRHHAAGEVIERLAELGIEVGLITNGFSLRSIDAALLGYLSWIRVSLDAGTPATYARFRPHPKGEEAYATVIAGIAHARASGVRRLGVSYVLLSRGGHDNIDEVAPAAATAKALGADYLNVKAMQNADHTIFHYSPHQVERIRRIFDEARRQQSEGFSVIGSENLFAVIDRRGPQVKDYDRCLSITLRALIAPDGMYPCAYHRGNQALRFAGDPSHDSFASLWDGADPSQIRPAQDCRFHCARHDANVRLNTLAGRASRGMDDAELEDWDLFI